MREKLSGVKNIICEKIHSPFSKKEKYDLDAYLANRAAVWTKILLYNIKKHNKIKFDTKFTVKLQKRQENNVYIYCNPCFRTESHILLSNEDILENVSLSIGKMVHHFDVYMKQGSGWLLDHIMSSQLNVYHYNLPKGGGGYLASRYFALKKRLLPSKYCNNNKCILFLEPTIDQKCFLYCVLALLFPQQGHFKQKVESYIPFVNELNTSNLKYPVDIGQIPEFEKNNALCINVFSVNKCQNLKFLYHSKMSIYKNRINLLLYKNHYSLILKWRCFLNYSGSASRNLCQTCGLFFQSFTKSEKKICKICSELCLETRGSQYKVQNLHFKNKREKLHFSNYKNLRKAPFIIYSDIETMACKISPGEDQSVKKSKTVKKQKHEPISIGYLRVCTNDKYSQKKPEIFTGVDCIEKFFIALESEIEYIENTLSNVNHPLHMNTQQELSHFLSKQCYVCGITLPDGFKMRDHDHLLEKCNYLGTICNSCNLNRTDNKNYRTTLVFHAGGKFDVNFLLQKIHSRKLDVSRVVGKTGEQIMSLSLFKNKILVIDSINHLPSSLANLVEILKKSDKPFLNTRKCVLDDDHGFELLSRKGVFPYEFIDSLDKLEINNLPSPEHFYNVLKGEAITDTDYAHAKNVWSHFKCKNLKHYMEIYLALDITLLADVFENYRYFFFTQFQIEVSRYLSLPGLSYDCMLKYTGSKIDYVYQKDVYNFLKRGVRGGISMIPHREFKANNPLLPKDYDPSKDTWHIIYIDANGLYSSIMNLKLPYKNLHWVNLKNLNSNKIDNIIESYKHTDNVGYFFEVDLIYPDGIKEKTKYFPLAPEHKIVSRDMLSPFSKMLQDKIGAKNDKVPKLLSTQFDKFNYVCHIENLQFYLGMGMKLAKVHKILQFQQKDFIRPYIEFCMMQRNKESTSPDERNMWKLASNAIFGKTIQNCEKMNSITFHTDEEKLLKSIASPRFKYADLINDKVAQVTSYKKKNFVNTPYFVGVAILELSKLFIMRVFYNIFVQKYGLMKLKLLLTDTDSLLLAIQTDDIYKDLKETGVMEFGNFPENNPYHEDSETGKMFYFKDESCGYPIQNFVGLRSKCYSIHYSDEIMKDKITAKGVNRGEIKKMRHEDMENVLHKNNTTDTIFTQIRSFKHQIYNVEQNKLSLSGLDTKRWVSWNNIDTLPFGHPEADPHVENFLGKNSDNYINFKIAKQEQPPTSTFTH